jgi:ornithine cyclodeaminase/alanine dehydrogenase-like protein (mu-crystallin family)
LLDPGTGELQAVLDGAYLTCLRTAAATALGAKYLARRDSRVLGILGTGAQARTHLLCHLRVHGYDKILVWGRTPAHVDAYVAEMTPQSQVPLEVASSADDLVAQSDVVTCTTSSRQPLFRADSVRPGTHIGVCAPMNLARSEVPLQLLLLSTLVLDSSKKFSKQWGSESLPLIHGELGDVIIGRIRGRQLESEITVFKPEGMAFEDVVSARVVLRNVSNNGAVHVNWQP